MVGYFFSSFASIPWEITVSQKLWIKISNVNIRERAFVFKHMNWLLKIAWDYHIKQSSQLENLVKIEIQSEQYKEIIKKSTAIRLLRNELYKDPTKDEEDRQKDQELYKKADDFSKELLSMMKTHKSYLNTIILIAWLEDLFIDLWNFTTAQKVKFDVDLGLYTIFKPIWIPNEYIHLKYLEFEELTENFLRVGKTIDNTLLYCYNSWEFLKDIEHLGSLIEVYLLSNTDEIKFTMMVSIIEYLLVVDTPLEKVYKKEADWITKQFKNKTYEIIERYNICTTKELGDIYSLRSNIVHWWKINKLKFGELYIKLKQVIISLLNERILDPWYFKVLKSVTKM